MRIVGTHFDLTARKEAEELAERQRIEQARTELLTRLVFAQEDERRRIAREMHDQFGEQLTTLARRIEALKEFADGRPGLISLIEALEAVARQIDRDVNHLVWQLRPTALDDLGLRAALANYIKDWSQRCACTRSCTRRDCSRIACPRRPKPRCIASPRRRSPTSPAIHGPRAWT